MIHSDYLIQESIKESKLQNSKARRKEVRKLLDYYQGGRNNTAKYITPYFNADAFKEVPIYTVNFTRRFINRMSRIYTIGADRNTNNAYKQLTMSKPCDMKHIERMTRLVGSIANQIIWTDEGLRSKPIYFYDAYFDTDPFRPASIIYPILLPVHDVSDATKLKYAYWDDQVYKQYDEDGKIEIDAQHGYGVLPFVFTHREEQIDSHFVEGASDIVEVNEHTNISLTELALGLRYQMFGQAWASGLDADKPITRAGSDVIISIPEGGSFGIEAPKGDINATIQAIKFQVELVAQNNHLWIHWAEQGGEMPSGISLMIKDLERSEDYKDDLDLWAKYEEDFFRVESAIAKSNGVDTGTKFSVNFIEPEYPQTVQDQIQWNEYRLIHNLTTESKLLNEINKDLTIKESEKIIIKNKEVNTANVTQEKPRSIFSRPRQATESV